MMAVGWVLILGAARVPGSIQAILLKSFRRYLGKTSFSSLLIAMVAHVSIALAAAVERMITVSNAALGHRLVQAGHDSRLTQGVLQQGRL